MMTLEILFMGILIFISRIIDVSLGTLRTIVTIQGRVKLAFILGFIEMLIWISVFSTVIQNVNSSPILIIFFTLGFATGNAVGIMLENKIALGYVILTVFTSHAGKSIATRLREQGQEVTTFIGEGTEGTVTELNVVCRRRDLEAILEIVLEEDPECFYITEHAKTVNRLLRPTFVPATGWRSIMKKK
ncbi:DUF5698 domain-containing protein [Deltaproteobacteria bacterium TL4]